MGTPLLSALAYSRTRATPLPAGLVWWNKMEGEVANEIPAMVGPAGIADPTPGAGVFSAGVYGNAIETDYTIASGFKIPGSVFNVAEGCIEMWVYAPSSRGAWYYPRFMVTVPGANEWMCYAYDYASATAHSFIFNWKIGGGGQYFMLPNIFSPTEPPGYLKKDTWQHAAWTWKKNAPGVSDQVWMTVDGVQTEMTGGDTVTKLHWTDPSAWPYLWLGTSGEGSYHSKWNYDNVKVWNYQKMDFSDRFVE